MRRFPRWLRAARRLLPALAACVVAAALIFGAFRSGARFFFCAGMGSLAERPCCAAAHDDRDADETARLDADDEDGCCARLDLGRLPEGTARAVEPVRTAPLLAVLPPVALAPSAPVSPVMRAAREATESPPPTAPQ